MTKTVEQIRAEVEAAKKVAMANFRRDWGTGDVREVWGALRETIPGSASPQDAVRLARRRIGGRG